jgi:hypothetical protein
MTYFEKDKKEAVTEAVFASLCTSLDVSCTSALFSFLQINQLTKRIKNYV